MTKLSKYEKETILNTSEGDEWWDVYTFNTTLKRRIEKFAKKYPDLCQIKEVAEDGGATYRISKKRLSIRITEPYSEERRHKARVFAQRSEMIRSKEGLNR